MVCFELLLHETFQQFYVPSVRLAEHSVISYRITWTADCMCDSRFCERSDCCRPSGFQKYAAGALNYGNLRNPVRLVGWRFTGARDEAGGAERFSAGRN
jgi:hypothetical protein